MRLAAVFLGTLAAGGVIVAVGCSGATADVPVVPEDIGPDPYAEPDAGANGTYVDRATACPAFVGALTKRMAELRCTPDPVPACPATLEDFERNKLGSVCAWVYDQGVIDNCARRVARYASCADFAAKPCTLVVKAGVGCPSSDGGTGG